MIDQGLAVVLATVVGALTYFALAVLNFRGGRNGVAAARLFAAVLFGAVAWYLAVFQLRLF